QLRSSYNFKYFDFAISFRDINEGNYWHFYDDFLSKLILIERLNIPESTPILVGENLWKKHFFQSAIKNNKLSKRNWVLHTELVKVNRLVFCAKMSLQRENFDVSLENLKPSNNLLHSNEQRIFLNRSQSRGRFIENFEEVVSILHKFDYQIVDADNLTLQQQIDLFSQVRYVVGLHGAGLVNLIHRRGQPLQLLEIFPPDFIHPHYFWLCHAFGYGYDAILGENGSQNSSFIINIENINNKISKMMEKEFI
ncbi:MAG: glycosyltransferase family 61 protein, partial [Rhizonema sp. PD37]|nr:glycosyltransferase family 61 protein [Rhizonema sp. PD37]